MARQEPAGPEQDRPAGGVSSRIDHASGNTVQSRDISGGIHFHTEPRPDLPAPARQLPAGIHGFVGREQELAALEAAVAGDGPSRGRLVVVVGTAGAGKTSLALRFAHRVRSRFPDGQLFVDLHGYGAVSPVAPGAALERFLRALGVAGSAVPKDLEERAELFRSLVAERRVLLVLDNAATVGQVRPLLPGDGECLVVVTSRGRLAGLSARDGAVRVTLGLLDQAEAVALIEAVTAGYRQGDDPGQVALLAQRCARLPLALRIAAERAAARPMMPLEDLIADLRGQSSLWDVLSSDEDQEADAVRSVFAWSYRALPGTAARAFRLLGLHPGPDFGPEAAAALIGDGAQPVRALLDALAGAHLIEQTGPRRYQFHDLLRAFAADTAAGEDLGGDEQRQALLRLAGWYLHTADAAREATQNLQPSVLTDPPDRLVVPVEFSGAQEAADWYLTERANLLALAHLAAARTELEGTAWKLSATLQTLQGAHGAGDERMAMSRLGLEQARRLGDRRAEARMLQVLALAHKATGDLESAVQCHRAALEIFTAEADHRGAIEAVNGIGLIHLRHRELDEAARYFHQGLELATAHGFEAWQVFLTNNQARTRFFQGLIGQAIELAEQAFAACNASGVRGEPRLDCLTMLIDAHRENGDLDEAERYADIADRQIADGAQYLALEIDVLLARAAIATARGQTEQALDLYWQCIQRQRPLAGRAHEAAAYTGIALALSGTDRRNEAAGFHQRAVELRRALPDNYNLADTLANLADALEDAGQTGAAQAARAEATGLLADYTDPRAAALRERLRARADPAATA
jgi:tetratricopeptide (TPR) repeat protein